MSTSWPRDLTIEENVGASLATGNLQAIIGRSRYPATVSSVTYTPTAAVTGASGNNRTLTLFNRGTGAATVSVATLTLVSGTDLTDNVPATITLASTGRDVNVGDILEWDSTANSSGVADPGGLVTVQFALRS
jgi:hypothetical protein